MPETSDDGDLDKILAELEKEPEETSTSKQDKDIKKTLHNIQYDEYIDTVKDKENDEDIKIEDEFE